MVLAEPLSVTTQKALGKHVQGELMNSWQAWIGKAAKVFVIAGSLGSLVGPVRAQAPSPGPRALGPVVRITSPLGDASVAPGEGKPGAGSLNGSGFLITIEAITRDAVSLTAKEALNVRDTSKLGQPNPLFPGLFVSFDVDLTKPDGGVIPKNTNLASLFNSSVWTTRRDRGSQSGPAGMCWNRFQGT